MEEEFKDVTMYNMLINITYRELKKCDEEEKVPSKEVLDTINTLINFHNSFFTKR